MPSEDSGPVIGDRHYTLVCSACGRQQADDGLILDCPGGHAAALLQTRYTETQFSPCPDGEGIFRYRRWLPTVRPTAGAGKTVVYRSERLARALGLPHLWIAFNGYWPERGAVLETGTFKELEAHAVLGRLPERGIVLTVASSGNTGAAFAWACSREWVPCLVVVPGKALWRFKFRHRLPPCVNLVSIDDGDYPDAMELVTELSRLPDFYAEGGVKNVGRRDGLATVLLSAYEKMECMPSHYFQAVGSGTGAIASLEAAKRIRAAAGDVPLPKLMLCQNRPFTPIYDAWRSAARSLSGQSPGHFRQLIPHVYADELTNWVPPYEIKGGVYDSLIESNGDVLAADNTAARTAAAMFLELEGIDIEPAAAVALACLRDAVAQGRVGRESVVLLNITGGGRRRLSASQSLIPAEPQLRLTRKSLGQDEAVERIKALSIPLKATEP